jgi:regulator of sigma E protease
MDQLISQGPLFIICLLLVLGTVIVVHEYGHYLAGRLFGAAVESFSVGFGPAIMERRDARGTRWRVNWVPLGGFVRFVSAAEHEAGFGREIAGRAYDDLTPLRKIVVSLAGPAANFVLAALLFTLLFTFNGVARHSVEIVDVWEGHAAAEAGLKPGDMITAVGGRPVRNISDVTSAILLSPNTRLPITVEREASSVDLVIVPREVRRENDFGQMVTQATAGIQLRRGPAQEARRFSPPEAAVEGVLQTGRTIEQTARTVGHMLQGRMSIDALSGPVGVADVSRRVVNRTLEPEQIPLSDRLRALLWSFVTICAAVSVGIGFFNLLPLPVLDGGRVVFHAYEALTGTPMPLKVEEYALKFSLAILLGLFAVVTWGDLAGMGLFGR